MKYYKFTADTPYCGTESTYYEAYEEEMTEKQLDEIAADYCGATKPTRTNLKCTMMTVLAFGQRFPKKNTERIQRGNTLFFF